MKKQKHLAKTRKHDKEPTGNFRTEKDNNCKFKMLQVASRAEWRTGRKESMNLKIEQDVTQPEQQRENGLEKQINRASGICGTITEDVPFVSSDSWKKKRKRAELKNHSSKLPKFGKKIKTFRFNKMNKFQTG